MIPSRKMSFSLFLAVLGMVSSGFRPLPALAREDAAKISHARKAVPHPQAAPSTSSPGKGPAASSSWREPGAPTTAGGGTPIWKAAPKDGAGWPQEAVPTWMPSTTGTARETGIPCQILPRTAGKCSTGSTGSSPIPPLSPCPTPISATAGGSGWAVPTGTPTGKITRRKSWPTIRRTWPKDRFYPVARDS